MNCVERIYKRIQDEESKIIYTNRILYHLTEDYRYMQKILNEVELRKELTNEIANHKNQPIVIFGAGACGQDTAKAFSEIKFECYVDNNPNRSVKYNVIPLITVDEMIKKYPDAFVILAVRHYAEEIKNQLMKIGFEEKNIYMWGKAITEFFADMYFDLKALPKVNDEVFVDCGCFDGENTIGFIKWSENQYKKIFVFEPDPKLMERCKRNLKGIRDIEFVGKGVWNKNTTLGYIEDSNNPMMGYVTEEFDNDCKIKVPVVALDEYFAGRDERVSFVKMDIEGSEIQALEGMKEIIKRDKPKIAMSIYHRKEDPLVLPDYLLKLNADYKFDVRHYNFAMYDTVMYAY